MLRRKYGKGGAGEDEHHDPHDLDAVKQSRLYKVFYPLMAPLLKYRSLAWLFLISMAVLTVGAMGLAAVRSVPLKMLPFDNKNELLLVLDFDEGTTLERSDAAVRDFESYLADVPEVVDYTSYVGLSSPMDFNGLVRHYYLRRGDNVAELRINLAGKEKPRDAKPCHRPADAQGDLQAIADRHHARMKLVETPPGPPVIATVVAEVYGQPDNSYDDILLAADTVRARLAAEPGVVDVDDVREAPQRKAHFCGRQRKSGPKWNYYRADRRHASGGVGGRHGGPGPQRYRTQSVADRVARARGQADQFFGPDACGGKGRHRSVGFAGRAWADGRRPAWIR